MASIKHLFNNEKGYKTEILIRYDKKGYRGMMLKTSMKYNGKTVCKYMADRCWLAGESSDKNYPIGNVYNHYYNNKPIRGANNDELYWDHD